MNIQKLKEKLKSVKNWEIYLAVAIGVVILLLTLSVKGDKDNTKTTQFDEYLSSMENKICSVVAKMDGVKKADVAISYSSAERKVYAYEKQLVTTGTNTNQTETIAKIGNQPLVVMELPPEICGVVVLAKGADTATKIKIVQLVVTLLAVSADKVQVIT